MLTDDWIISQIFVQVLAGLMVFYALLKSVKIIRFWENGQNTALQIRLEQESYLVSNILQVMLGVQMLLFVYFLQTVNHHIPPLLRGAMCATGALGANEYGFVALYGKILMLLLAVIFLCIDYRDAKTPYFSLTPTKYYWVFPVALVYFGDVFCSFLYFYKLNPDIIATCCSVNFLVSEQSSFFTSQSPLTLQSQIQLSFWFFYVVGFVLLFRKIFVFFRKKSVGGFSKTKFFKNAFFFFLLNIWLVNAVFLLQNFFVKYIYGVPSHTCLFDIFWGEYYFVGYVIFGGYFLAWAMGVWALVFDFFEQKITTNHKKYANIRNDKYLKIEIFVYILNLIIPTIYYLVWEGRL